MLLFIIKAKYNIPASHLEVMFEKGQFMVIAGPCTVEEDTFQETVDFLLDRGIKHIRGNLFRPRTPTSNYQGMGKDGLQLLEEARKKGAKIICEAGAKEQVSMIADTVSAIQIGARNMDNKSLLSAVVHAKLPVMLKRSPSATMDELLTTASVFKDIEVVLCERGINAVNKDIKYTLDLASAVSVQRKCDLPVIVDPSHSTGRRDLVTPMSLAAMAAGLDGIMVEVHPEPCNALSDAEQTLDFKQFDEMLCQLDKVSTALGITMLGK
jgi:3-deoxy-7-phosphoheptulonate synthase